MCSLQTYCPSTLEWVEVYRGTIDSCMEAAIKFRAPMRIVDL